MRRPKVFQSGPGHRRQQKNINGMALAEAVDKVSEQAEIQTHISDQQAEDQPAHHRRDVSVIDERVDDPTEGNEVKNQPGHKTEFQGSPCITVVNSEK